MQLHDNDGVVALAVYGNAVVMVVDEEVVNWVLQADFRGRVNFTNLFLWADKRPKDGELGAFEIDKNQFLAGHWFFKENSALLILKVDLQREWLMLIEHQRIKNVVLDLRA